jgi:hypothetical protein
MKKSIKNLGDKEIKNIKAVKGGALGRGKRGSAAAADNHADLL